jgi:hypothetical protein
MVDYFAGRGTRLVWSGLKDILNGFESLEYGENINEVFCKQLNV